MSSTGFSDGAISFADEKNIRLRTFDALSPADVHSWLPFMAPVLVTTLKLISVFFLVVEDNIDSGHSELVQERRSIKTDELFILLKSTCEKVSLKNIWDRYHREHLGHLGPFPLGKTETMTIKIDSEFLNQYTISEQDRKFQLKQMEVGIEATTDQPEIPLVDVGHYRSDQQVLRTIAHWKGPSDGDIREVFVILTPKEKQ